MLGSTGRFLDRHPRFTIWLIAGVALGGMVLMIGIVLLIIATR